jgi:high mobility group protein B1
MSSKSVLQTEITNLKTALAERDAKIAELTAVSEAKPKRAKKERAQSDPTKPRMLTPYIVFCMSERAKAPADSKLKASDLGEMWKLLTPEARATYKSVPATPKEPKMPKEPKTPKTPKAKKERDPDAPKKPLSGFLLFSKQERAKTPDVKLKAVDLSARWNALSDDAKSGYKSS